MKYGIIQKVIEETLLPFYIFAFFTYLKEVELKTTSQNKKIYRY